MGGFSKHWGTISHFGEKNTTVSSLTEGRASLTPAVLTPSTSVLAVYSLSQRIKRSETSK